MDKHDEKHAQNASFYYLLAISTLVIGCYLAYSQFFPRHTRLTEDPDVVSLMEAFRKEPDLNERTRYAIAIKKRSDDLLGSCIVAVTPSEMLQALGEPNEVAGSEGCASNSLWYWFSPESRTNGLLHVFLWHSPFSKRANRLVGMFVATYAEEWEE